MATKDELVACIVESLDRHTLQPWEIVTDIVELTRRGALWPAASMEEWFAAIDHGVAVGKLEKDGQRIRAARTQPAGTQDAKQLDLF